MTEIELLKLELAIYKADQKLENYLSESRAEDIKRLKERLEKSQLKINQAITVLSGVFDQDKKPSTMLQQIICEKEKISKALEILKLRPEHSEEDLLYVENEDDLFFEGPEFEEVPNDGQILPF